jgi:hypothetical protein
VADKGPAARAAGPRLSRQQRSDDKMVKIDVHIPGDNHVSISAVTAADVDIHTLVRPELVCLVDVITHVCFFDLVIAVKVDLRSAGDSAAGIIGVATVASRVMARIGQILIESPYPFRM